MPNCRSCGATIEWVTTKKGKHMPVDPDSVTPSEMEPTDILVNDDGHVCQAQNADEDYPAQWHISHFATCPEADQHRKK